MGDLYDSATLALKKDEMPQFRHAAFDKAARAVYERGEFSPAMLRDERVRGLIDETNRVLSSALTVSHETPPELTAALRNNVFIFSGLKPTIRSRRSACRSPMRRATPNPLPIFTVT